MGDSLMKEFFAGLVALLQRKNTSKYRERVLTSKKCEKTTSCTFLLNTPQEHQWVLTFAIFQKFLISMEVYGISIFFPLKII